MNITFLIGNGFDVGMGMHSKFSDYFPIYIEDSKDKVKSLKDFADEIAEDEEKWSVFEKQLGVYTNKFSLETKYELIEQVQDFELGFIDYLKKEEEHLDIENIQNFSYNFSKALSDFYLNDNLPYGSAEAIKNVFSGNKSSAHNYNFINFNYSNVLDRCLLTVENGVVKKRSVGGNEKKDIIKENVHVHGKYGVYPMMGVNDSSQISNKELAKDTEFISNFVKPLINERIRMGFHAKAKKLIDESTIICVYGMALGETDKIWWKNIVNWLVTNSTRHLVIFDYDEEYTMNSQFAWIKKENTYINKLGNLSGVSVESVRSRIHLAVHKNIFSIEELSK